MPKDEKGKPEKEYTIVVNGREKTVTATELGEDDLVALAYENPPKGELICFTITVRRQIIWDIRACFRLEALAHP